MKNYRKLSILLAFIFVIVACSTDDGPDTGRRRGPPPVETFFPDHNYYVLADNAFELTPESNALAEVEPNRLSFPASSPEAKALLSRAPGDVLFGRAAKSNPKNPLGFMRVVKTIYQDGDKLVITTRQAALTEVFAELFFATPDAAPTLNIALGAEMASAPSTPRTTIMQAGGSQQEIPTAYLSLVSLPDTKEYQPSIDFENAKGGKVVLSGRLDADPIFEITPGVTLLIWIWDFQLKNFLFTVEGTAKLGFDVDVQGQVTLGKDVVPGFAKAQSGGPRYITPPMPIPGTPIPVSVRAEVEPKCSITVSGAAKIALGATRDLKLGRKGLFFDDDSEQAVSHRRDAQGNLLGPTDFGGAACQSGFDHTNACQHANRKGPTWFELNWPDADGGWQTTEQVFQVNGGVDASCWVESDLKFLIADVAGPLVRLDMPRLGGRANLSYGATPGYCFATGNWELYAGAGLSAGVTAQLPILGAEIGTTGLISLMQGDTVLKTGPLSPPLGDCKACIATSPSDPYASCYGNEQCCSGKCDKKSNTCLCAAVGGSCRGDNDCCDGSSCDATTLRCVAKCADVACTPGKWSCLDTKHRAQCMKSANSCSYWSLPATCPSGQVCSAGSCVPEPKTACGNGVCDGETCSGCPEDCGECCELDGGACAVDGDCCDGHCQNGTCQWLSCGGLAKVLSWGNNALCEQPGQNVCNGGGQPSSDCKLCCDADAVPACKGEWQSCSTSAECCDGLDCTKDPGDNTLACFKSTPVPTCKGEWQSCSTTGECCANLACKKDPGDNTFACQQNAPTCKGEWQSCSGSECCAGLSCKKDPGDNTFACQK